jgi:hypothetical protein
MKTTKKIIQNSDEHDSSIKPSLNESAIILVSGLPRSGTSMMMRMLEAGGMDLLVDHIRKADEDNPKGYYEFEKIKKIKKDSSWLESSYGKAVKVVSMLLYQMPEHKKYKVIFIKRDMSEILASQKKMLERRGQPTGRVNDHVMAMKFNAHLMKLFKWLDEQENMLTHFVSYNDVISDPMEQSRRINRFLGNRLEVDKMVNVVDSSLYRQRR